MRIQCRLFRINNELFEDVSKRSKPPPPKRGQSKLTSVAPPPGQENLSRNGISANSPQSPVGKPPISPSFLPPVSMATFGESQNSIVSTEFPPPRIPSLPVSPQNNVGYTKT